MATAEEYKAQLEGMGNMPDFRNTIASAYQNPVIKPITQEASDLYSSYLPTIFSAFQSGTGAGDMSAAAKLANIGSILGRQAGKIAANKDVQNFYLTQINDLANAEMTKWQQRQQQLKDLWNMTFQKEEADRQARESAAARASINAASSGIDWNKIAGSLQTIQPQQVSSSANEVQTLISQREKLANKIRSIPKVNYLKPDGSVGSKAQDPTQDNYLRLLYYNLQKLGYNDIFGLAGGNPF